MIACNFFRASSFAPKLLPGHLKGSGVGKFKLLQTTGTPSPPSSAPTNICSINIKDLSSLSDTEILPLPQGGGSKSSSRASQGHHRDAGTSAAWSAGRADAECPETTSTLTELPWGAQEEKEEGRKEGCPPERQPSSRRLTAARAHKVLLSAVGCTASPGMGTKPLVLPLPRHM